MTENVPTGRELEALKVLWARGKATVREIYQEMKPPDGEGESGLYDGAQPVADDGAKGTGRARAGRQSVCLLPSRAAREHVPQAGRRVSRPGF